MPEALLLPDLARSITMSFRGGHAGTMYTLYSMQRSGNSYKVRLGLARLGVPYRLLEVDILKGESRTPEFLAMNPSGQVPLLEVAPGRHIAESNAILWYVAIGSRPFGFLARNSGVRLSPFRMSTSTML